MSVIDLGFIITVVQVMFRIMLPSISETTVALKEFPCRKRCFPFIMKWGTFADLTKYLFRLTFGEP